MEEDRTSLMNETSDLIHEYIKKLRGDSDIQPHELAAILHAIAGTLWKEAIPDEESRRGVMTYAMEMALTDRPMIN